LFTLRYEDLYTSARQRVSISSRAFLHIRAAKKKPPDSASLQYLGTTPPCNKQEQELFKTKLKSSTVKQP
jgi:hypothetical protein